MQRTFDTHRPPTECRQAEAVRAASEAQQPWWDPDPEGRARLRDAVSRAAAGESVRFDMPFRAAGDRWLPLDIGLPDIDGNDLARRLRIDCCPACPGLIALSGRGRADDKRRAREAGFERHFTKPVEPSAIAHALAEGATDGGWRD